MVELLVATALAAVLMIAVLGLTAGLVRQQQRAATMMDGPPPWHSDLLDLLRFDLLNARQVTAGKDRLELVGWNSLGPESLEPQQRPVRVVYTIHRGGGWLVREQSALDQDATAPKKDRVTTLRHLVCGGVVSLSVKTTPLPPPSKGETPAVGLVPVTLPDRAEIELLWVDAARQPFRHTFRLR